MYGTEVGTDLQINLQLILTLFVTFYDIPKAPLGYIFYENHFSQAIFNYSSIRSTLTLHLKNPGKGLGCLLYP